MTLSEIDLPMSSRFYKGLVIWFVKLSHHRFGIWVWFTSAVTAGGPTAGAAKAEDQDDGCEGE